MKDRQAHHDGFVPPTRAEAERQPDHASDPGVGNRATGGLLGARDEGAPLPPGVRTKMQLRLGRDLGAVRFHDDADAHRSAHDLDALAYTTGEHVVLGAGAPDLSTAAGEELLTHELTHVVQQRDAATVVDGVSDPSDAAEAAASSAAHGGGPAAAAGGPVHAVQRQPVLGKERMVVKRDEGERILADYLQQVLESQGGQTIRKTPQVIEAITSLFRDKPVLQASVAEWLTHITDGTPTGLAHQVAAKLPAEIPDNLLDKLRGKPTVPGSDSRPKTAGEAAGSVIVDSTVAPVVRATKLSKDMQDKIIGAARSAVADGIIAVLDSALDAAGVTGAEKAAIHAAGEAALKQQPGKSMDRQQGGAGSPDRKEPPPSVAPPPARVPGQVIIPSPTFKWDFPGVPAPRRPPAQLPKIDPAVEKAAAAVDPRALVPDGVTGGDADEFGTAVDFALSVAHRLDTAQTAKNTNLTIELGAQYESGKVKDRSGVLQRAKAIVFAMRDALPHHAALVERVNFTVNGKIVFSFPLHPSPDSGAQ
jgi:hypothetical protein